MESGSTQRTVYRERRQANYELLRIVAMLMVVTLHYMHSADLLLRPDAPVTGLRIAGNFVESFCICAVNTYVLITGCFLPRSGFRLGRILQLILEVYFYAMLIPLLLTLAGTPVAGAGSWDMFYYLLPISSNHYWFATSYVILYLFSPLLNAAADRLTRRQLKFTIAFLIVIFCLIKSVCPVHLQTDRYGYDFGWFLCLYLIAAYIRRYDAGRFATPRRAALLYFGSSLATFLLTVLLTELNHRSLSLIYYATVPFHYNALLVLTAAIGLFLLFRYVKIPEGGFATAVRKAAPYTFGVYLIHNHMDVRDRWLPFLKEILGEVPGTVPAMLLHMAGCVLAVFFACLFADWVRSILFAFAARLISKTKFTEKVRNVDRLFREERQP